MNRFIDATDLLNALEVAIKAKDKRAILDLYEQAHYWDWENMISSKAERYDQLVQEGNDILYS